MMDKIFSFRTLEPQKPSVVLDALSQVVGPTQRADDPNLLHNTAMLSCVFSEYEKSFDVEASSDLLNREFISLMAKQLQTGVVASCPHWQEQDPEMAALGYTPEMPALVLAMPDGSLYAVSEDEDNEEDDSPSLEDKEILRPARETDLT